MAQDSPPQSISFKNVRVFPQNLPHLKACEINCPSHAPTSVSTEPRNERNRYTTDQHRKTIDHFGDKISFVNVMRNMSVSCDCEGVHAIPVIMPNVGILASTDILAIDQACVGLVYAMKEEDHADLIERFESRHGLRQLSYMKELGMGNDRYRLIDLDNDDEQVSCAQAVEHVVPFEE